ncbi:MAG: hypothetical protein RMX68_021880 [Aulosira sp. ZfuVER01]|nr:hypothetical protein [Aulosira sp. ZfuCHP01]
MNSTLPVLRWNDNVFKAMSENKPLRVYAPLQILNPQAIACI